MARQQPIGVARLVQFLAERVAGKFSGTVTILFRDGAIMTVRREETWVEHEQLPVADQHAVHVMEDGRSRERVAAS